VSRDGLDGRHVVLVRRKQSPEFFAQKALLLIDSHASPPVCLTFALSRGAHVPSAVGSSAMLCVVTIR
jgi:hypothetical protein